MSIELSKKLIELSPEDEKMKKYNERLLEFQKYFSDVTCKNKNARVVDQKDMDMAEESLKLVKEMQAFYKNNSSKIINYSRVAEFYTIANFEKRCEEVKKWKNRTDERYNESQLIKDYMHEKKDGIPSAQAQKVSFCQKIIMILS